MGFIEKRSGGYRARYRDPLGRLTSKTFTRKADAERWVKEMEVDIERVEWLDPRSAHMPLAVWAEEFVSLTRRLSPSTQETYRRDLQRYIVPRFGAYPLGWPARSSPPLDDVVATTKAQLDRNRYREGRFVADATITSIARKAYLDIEPWPFQALL